MIRSPRLGLGAVVLAALLAACTTDGDDAVPTTLESTTTSLPPAVVTDGQLVIGLLVPDTDTLLAEPVRLAANEAVDRINAAGGVLGRPVRLLIDHEGDSTATASAAIRSMIDRQVDAIVGPASSLIALSTLDEIVSSGTVACSPTATAMTLDGFPDDGLFFRTVPSDSLQAIAIAQAADQTGAQRATVVYVDDVYGRAFAGAVASALGAGAISSVTSIPFPADGDVADAIAGIDTSVPQTVVVLADGEDGSRVLEAIDEIDNESISSIVVNDALRNVPTPQRIQNLDPDLRARIVGIAPQAEALPPAAPFDPPGLFAANTFDCVNLIALAAVRADSDAPRAIATDLASITVSGSACRTFAECVAAIGAGLQIDYNGPSGVTDLQARTGDPSRAIFDRFGFDANGQDTFQRTVTVSG